MFQGHARRQFLLRRKLRVPLAADNRRHCRTRALATAAGLLAILVATRLGLAEDLPLPADPEATGAADAESAPTLIETMLSERDKLRRGIVRGHGKVFYEDPRYELETAVLSGSPVESFCAFDWDRGWWRFDNQEQSHMRRHGVTPRDPSNPERPPETTSVSGIFTNIYKSARTRDYVVRWSGYADIPDVRNDVIIFGPGASFDVDLFHHPFDPRAVGLFQMIGFFKGQTVEEAAAMHRHPATAVQHRDNGIVVVHTRYAAGADRYLHIDTIHGHTVVRHEVYEDRFSNAGHSAPSQLAEARWRLQQDVWIPEWFSLAIHTPTAARSHRYEYDLEWESLNEPVDEDLFWYTGFGDLPEGTHVMDRRQNLEEPALVEVIGRPTPQILHELPARNDPPAESRSELRRWLMIINLSVLLALAVYFIVRRLTRGRT